MHPLGIKMHPPRCRCTPLGFQMHPPRRKKCTPLTEMHPPKSAKCTPLKFSINIYAQIQIKKRIPTKGILFFISPSGREGLERTAQPSKALLQPFPIKVPSADCPPRGFLLQLHCHAFITGAVGRFHNSLDLYRLLGRNFHRCAGEDGIGEAFDLPGIHIAKFHLNFRALSVLLILLGIVAPCLPRNMASSLPPST